MNEPKPKPKVNLNYIYSYCRDVAAVQRFYACLGMQEGSASEQHLCLDSEGVQLDFFQDEACPPARKTFSAQPGGGGGEDPMVSWSIQLPEADFGSAVAKLQALGVPANMPEPKWLVNSYWAYVVLDPAGNTVEVYMTPKTKPASTEWPGR